MSRLYAVIDPASPRHAEWLRDLGSDSIPIRPGGPVAITIDDVRLGRPREALAYFADLDALTQRQLGAIVCTMLQTRPAARTGIEVIREMRRVGFPILAEDVLTGTDPDEVRRGFTRRA